MNKTSAQRPFEMPATLSLYFDLVRFISAVIVVLHHTWTKVFPLSTIRWPGHEAVVVFFVLSGYVIAYTGTSPRMTLADYIRNRCARVLPVAYAALLLALMVASLLGAEMDSLAWPTLANMFFIAQSGWLMVEGPLHAPFWSLDYEIWYYAIFAAWSFSSLKRRYLVTGLVMLMAGPKILLLLPVWLMGVWLLHARLKLSRGQALSILCASFAIAALMFAVNISASLRTQLYAYLPFIWRANYSTQFLYDYLLGFMVTANFAAAASLQMPRYVLSAERLIRYLAGFTFTLYLCHMTIGILLHDVLDIHTPLVYYGGMAMGVFVIAQFTERRVRLYRSLLESFPWRMKRAPGLLAE